MKYQTFGQLRWTADNRHLKLRTISGWIAHNELAAARDFVEHDLASCIIVYLHMQVASEIEGDTASATEPVEYFLKHGWAGHEEPSRRASSARQPLQDDYLPPFRCEPASK